MYIERYFNTLKGGKYREGITKNNRKASTYGTSYPRKNFHFWPLKLALIGFELGLFFWA